MAMTVEEFKANIEKRYSFVCNELEQDQKHLSDAYNGRYLQGKIDANKNYKECLELVIKAINA